jgi:AhpD family alkylhydroperoxidase
MSPRSNIFHTAPEGAKAMMAAEKAVQESGLEHSLLELVRLRASQINGCAFCIAMHVKEAVAGGEDPLRLNLLNAWRESSRFTKRERAALNWAESLTRVAKTHAPDADYALLESEFTEREIGTLTLVIATINAWNRIQIGLRAPDSVGEAATAAACAAAGRGPPVLPSPAGGPRHFKESAFMLDVVSAPVSLETSVAHDLRNLLQTASAAIRIIERGTSGRSPHVEDALIGARASIEKASDLARRTFERGVRNQVSAPAVDVSNCLKNVASILKYAIPPSIDLAIESDRGLRLATCDELGLQSALLNLAFNAVEAAVGEGRVTLRARAGDDPSMIAISVEDDGIGMTEATMARAFDPFFTTKCEGLGGVGLATVEQFVTSAGGRIAIESELGSGTTIVMLLPAAPALNGSAGEAR